MNKEYPLFNATDNIVYGNDMSPLKCSLKEILIALEYVTLRIMLEIIYIYGLSTNYSYDGYTISNNPSRYVLSWIIYLIFLPQQIKYVYKPTVSKTIYIILFVTSFLPTIVMFAYKDTQFIAWFVLYWLVFGLGMEYVRVPKIKLGEMRKLTLTKGQFIIAGVLLTSITVFIWARYTHFRVNFNIIDVYGIRREFMDYNIPIIIRYIYTWVTRLMPFFVVWCLSNKYYAMSMFFAFTQLVYFFVDGSKTTFFSLVIVVLAYLVLKKHPRLIREIILAFDAVTVACITQLIVLHGGIGKILSVFVRRVFFVPAKLNYDYYDYFSINPLNYYSNVIKFITPVYPKGVPAEIGFFRNGYYGESANNGLFSDAIANLGLVGCVVMPIAVVIVLKLFDVVSEGINEAVLVSVIIAVSRPLFGSSFFTGLITHGLLVMMLLLYCMPRNRWEKTHRIY